MAVSLRGTGVKVKASSTNGYNFLPLDMLPYRLTTLPHSASTGANCGEK